MTDTERERAERRLYPRLRAPVYCSPVGLPLFPGKRRPLDIGLGGVRVYTDEELKEGSRLELEIFLPDGTSVVFKVEVVWVDKLPEGAPARCDVGLMFTAIHPQYRERLSSVLKQA